MNTVDPLLAKLHLCHRSPPPPHGQFWFWMVDDDTQEQRTVAVPEIQKVVAEYYGLATRDLVSGRRSSAETMARHVAMYLCRTLTPLGHLKIGLWFNRHHTTALHATNRVRRLIAENAGVVRDIDALRKRLA